MTLLERKKRRKSGGKYFAKAFSKKFAPPRKRNTVTGAGTRPAEAGASNDKKPVDKSTERAIQVEVLDLLRGRGGGTLSVFDMASALSESNKVREAYSENPSKGTLRSRMNRFGQKVANRLGISTNEKMRRRYELTNVFKEIQQEREAQARIVDSWETARAVLSMAIEFPDEKDESGALVAEGQVEGVRKSLQKIAMTPYSNLDLEPSEKKWRQIATASLPPKLGGLTDEDKDVLTKELEAQYAEREEARKSQVVQDLERRREEKEKEEEAKKLASSLLRDFTAEENNMVHDAIWGSGSSSEVFQSEGSDTVQRASMRMLQPGQWLNDEVIHYFYLMLGKRDEELCKAESNRKRSHFFKSFFITKLLNEGHNDPAKDGAFEYRNVKRWSKKVPGKDIFQLNKIFFPINQGRMHWVCAVAFMQEKRIQFYDSMGAPGRDYLDHVFKYIQEEHQDKKKSPLPDIAEWNLVPCTADTPRQGNGYDCGVFTCMFADFLSKDCPLLFTQQHVDQCRQRIGLSICLGKAII